MTSSADSAEIERLVAEALTVIERGEAVELGRLCAARPDLEESVGAALARAADIADVHKVARVYDPLVGRILANRYRVEERIGAGAMGVVYRARDDELSRAVAVKLLRSDLVANPRIEERFAREAEVLARINHSAVVTIYDRGRAEDGRAFLVMELLVGETAAALLAGDRDGDWPVDVRRAVRWIATAAEGLLAAHGAGVVHRDIKPSNLFLTEAGNAVLLDFGIVSMVDETTALTATGTSLGTPAYMAPEQLDARDEPGPATDVYGLAATLYHLVTGRPPYSGEPQQVLAALASREPEPADRVRPGLPPDLVAVLEKGMAREPSERYASASDLRDDLLAWLDYRPVQARRLTRLHRVLRNARRSPRVRAAAATVLVIALVFAVWQIDASLAAMRQDRLVTRLALVPPSLVVSPASYRATSAVTQSDEVARLLDSIVEVADEPCPAYALRAMHRLDRGELGRAAEDLEHIAGRAGAPVASWLAAEFRAGRVVDLGADPAAAPAPSGADDRYVAALFALRSAAPNGRFAAEVLRGVEYRGERIGFDELLLSAEMLGFDPQREGGAQQYYRALEKRATELEIIRGRPVATVLQVRANALSVQGRLRGARDVVARAIALAPEDFVLQTQRAGVAFKRHDYATAVVELRRAVELQPRSVHAHELLVLSLVYEGDMAAGERVLAATPFDADRNPVARKAMLEGKVLFEQAFVALSANDEDPRGLELAGAALEAFERARAAGAATTFEELACAVLVDDSPELVDDLIEYLAGAPLDPHRLRSIAPLLGTVLDETQTRAIKQLLLAQATKLLSVDR